MKKKISLLLTALTVVTVLAEELSNISPAEIAEKVHVSGPIIPRQVEYSSAAGVGTFTEDCSTTNVTFVDISVQQWWTPDPGTNIVRVSKIRNLSVEWIFPTNVPVVFFAITKAQWYGENAEYHLTNAAERAELTFGDADRSWFRVTRDNGLVYTFATNLWNCVRANPNPTNYYVVLRDAERTVAEQNSWRVNFDAYHGLSFLLDDAPESYLAEKLNDPLLSPIMKNSVGNRLRHRYGWTYNYTNNVEVWTPPQ